MNTNALNIATLNAVSLNNAGMSIKKRSRYVPDNEIPDSHTAFYAADSEQFFAADTGFYVKM